MSPKILLEKNKERENRVSEEKERRRRKRKTMAALLVFLDLCLRGEPYFGCNVIQKSSSDIYFSYPCGSQKSDLKRIYFKI